MKVISWLIGIIVTTTSAATISNSSTVSSKYVYTYEPVQDFSAIGIDSFIFNSSKRSIYIHPSNRELIESYIIEQAIKNNVNPSMALFIAGKESAYFDEDVISGQRIGDTHLICRLENSPHYGEPIRSRGLWQINECAHWYITDEEAFDVVWSTNWAIEQMKKDPTIWSTYKDWKSFE